ncbi:hypothetical protein PGAL8A_00521200 [Plasmodium gallinaceum]|uniref:Uncharacterized protein n=1 Tax=Plasmodium gallinaceum TaxID=5849 RepID=A0A1J1GYJ5_PLAGA|nr:hypothetical protein PGAL8A_00521200 [Plasmodium gallinaceum]CRG97636.1 hypothetical protein PGAL8A_00521200 [Plasmodium gallinaceum]
MFNELSSSLISKKEKSKLIRLDDPLDKEKEKCSFCNLKKKKLIKLLRCKSCDDIYYKDRNKIKKELFSIGNFKNIKEKEKFFHFVNKIKLRKKDFYKIKLHNLKNLKKKKGITDHKKDFILKKSFNSKKNYKNVKPKKTKKKPTDKSFYKDLIKNNHFIKINNKNLKYIKEKLISIKNKNMFTRLYKGSNKLKNINRKRNVKGIYHRKKTINKMDLSSFKNVTKSYRNIKKLKVNKINNKKYLLFNKNNFFNNRKDQNVYPYKNFKKASYLTKEKTFSHISYKKERYIKSMHESSLKNKNFFFLFKHLKVNEKKKKKTFSMMKDGHSNPKMDYKSVQHENNKKDTNCKKLNIIRHVEKKFRNKTSILSSQNKLHEIIKKKYDYNNRDKKKLYDISKIYITKNLLYQRNLVKFTDGKVSNSSFVKNGINKKSDKTIYLEIKNKKIILKTSVRNTSFSKLGKSNIFNQLDEKLKNKKLYFSKNKNENKNEIFPYTNENNLIQTQKGEKEKEFDNKKSLEKKYLIKKYEMKNDNFFNIRKNIFNLKNYNIKDRKDNEKLYIDRIKKNYILNKKMHDKKLCEKFKDNISEKRNIYSNTYERNILNNKYSECCIEKTSNHLKHYNFIKLKNLSKLKNKNKGKYNIDKKEKNKHMNRLIRKYMKEINKKGKIKKEFDNLIQTYKNLDRKKIYGKGEKKEIIEDEIEVTQNCLIKGAYSSFRKKENIYNIPFTHKNETNKKIIIEKNKMIINKIKMDKKNKMISNVIINNRINEKLQIHKKDIFEKFPMINMNTFENKKDVQKNNQKEIEKKYVYKNNTIKIYKEGIKNKNIFNYLGDKFTLKKDVDVHSDEKFNSKILMKINDENNKKYTIPITTAKKSSIINKEISDYEEKKRVFNEYEQKKEIKRKKKNKEEKKVNEKKVEQKLKYVHKNQKDENKNEKILKYTVENSELNKNNHSIQDKNKKKSETKLSNEYQPNKKMNEREIKLKSNYNKNEKIESEDKLALLNAYKNKGIYNSYDKDIYELHVNSYENIDGNNDIIVNDTEKKKKKGIEIYFGFNKEVIRERRQEKENIINMNIEAKESFNEKIKEVHIVKKNVFTLIKKKQINIEKLLDEDTSKKNQIKSKEKNFNINSNERKQNQCDKYNKNRYNTLKKDKFNFIKTYIMPIGKCINHYKNISFEKNNSINNLKNNFHILKSVRKTNMEFNIKNNEQLSECIYNKIFIQHNLKKNNNCMKDGKHIKNINLKNKIKTYITVVNRNKSVPLLKINVFSKNWKNKKITNTMKKDISKIKNKKCFHFLCTNTLNKNKKDNFRLIELSKYFSNLKNFGFKLNESLPILNEEKKSFYLTKDIQKFNIIKTNRRNKEKFHATKLTTIKSNIIDDFTNINLKNYYLLKKKNNVPYYSKSLIIKKNKYWNEENNNLKKTKSFAYFKRNLRVSKIFTKGSNNIKKCGSIKTLKNNILSTNKSYTKHCKYVNNFLEENNYEIENIDVKNICDINQKLVKLKDSNKSKLYEIRRTNDLRDIKKKLPKKNILNYYFNHFSSISNKMLFNGNKVSLNNQIRLPMYSSFSPYCRRIVYHKKNRVCRTLSFNMCLSKLRNTLKKKKDNFTSSHNRTIIQGVPRVKNMKKFSSIKVKRNFTFDCCCKNYYESTNSKSSEQKF